MKKENIRKNVNKGFSLVELIVVIAVMAVLTSTLAPALLNYVERSRAQKDDSAVSEITNAINLALSDQTIYDEVLKHTANNYSCYVDKDTTSIAENGTNITIFKGELGTNKTSVDGYYMFIDSARDNDEEKFKAAGLMRGATITFTANGSSLEMKNGVVNRYLDNNNQQKLTNTGAVDTNIKYGEGFMVTGFTVDVTNKLDTLMPNLYARIRATVGESIPIESQTYRNSDYTVFIRMGSQGGSDASAQDAVIAHGQWNGTNLLAPAAN